MLGFLGFHSDLSVEGYDRLLDPNASDDKRTAAASSSNGPTSSSMPGHLRELASGSSAQMNSGVTDNRPTIKSVRSANTDKTS